MRQEELERLGKTLADHRRRLTALVLKTEDLEAAVIMALDRQSEKAKRKIETSPFQATPVNRPDQTGQPGLPPGFRR